MTQVRDVPLSKQCITAKFVEVQGQVKNDLNAQRHLIDRTKYRNAFPRREPNGGYSRHKAFTRRWVLLYQNSFSDIN